MRMPSATPGVVQPVAGSGLSMTAFGATGCSLFANSLELRSRIVGRHCALKLPDRMRAFPLTVGRAAAQARIVCNLAISVCA
jgi:hypothetical protein